jgi:hypothetical protein
MAIDDKPWQTCPTCDFSFTIGEDELAGEDVVCGECGTFFPYDPADELPERPL